MTKYEKIANWIISQDVSKGLKDSDIKEIAEMMFGEKLTNTGVKYVKEELLNKDYTNFRDSEKPPVATSLEQLLDTKVTVTQLNDNWIEFMIKKSYPKDRLITLLKSAGVSRKDIEANQIDGDYRIVNIYNADEYDFEFSFEDSKFRDSKPYSSTQEKADAIIEYYNDRGNAPSDVEYALTKLFGDKYDNIKYIVEINLIDLAKVYDYMKKSYQKEINRYPKGHEVPTSAFEYFGLIQRKVKDSKFRDSPDWETLKKSKDFVLKRLFKELEEEKAKPMSIDQENNIADIKAQIRKRAKEIKNVPNDIYDKKVRDAKLYWDLEYDRAVDESYIKKLYNRMVNLAYINPKKTSYEEFKKNAFDEITEDKKAHYGIKDAKSAFHKTVTRLVNNPKQLDKYSQEELQDLLTDVINEREGVKEGIYANELDELYGLLDLKRAESLKDAKLNRKQKLWYGEELEKFIYPQYLKRNYQLKRIKRKGGK